MKLDEHLLSPDLATAGADAAALETAGYDGLWTAETAHDPFLPLATAAVSTTRLGLGTSIAVAFPRSPMVTAMLAWDLQRASSGRFVLGLGTQVKAHNRRRFSVEGDLDRPWARLRELVECLRHVWGAFQGEHRLDFRGTHYRADLLTPFFDPGPIEHPRIPVYLAAVTPTAYRICGELADGVHVHPFHTPGYLREIALPALDRSGRNRPVLAAPVFTIVGDDPAAERYARGQIAFYATTPAYLPVLEHLGVPDLGAKLRALMGAGDLDGMAAALPDRVVSEVAVAMPTWPAAAAEIARRYRGLVDRVAFNRAPGAGPAPGDVAAVREALAS